MQSKFISIPFLLLFSCVCSRPSDLDVKGYLYKYGYLSSSDELDDKIMERAIRDFQKSVGIKQTGIINKETSELMNRPRCGMPESAKIPVQKPGSWTWRTNHLTYKIRNWTEAISEERMRRTLKNSIRLWTRNVNLSIEEASTDQACLNVHFSYIDGRDGSTLAYAYYPEHGGIFFDSAKGFTLHVNKKSGYLLAQVAAHELGHALGLGHSQRKSSIMFPIYGEEVVGPSVADRNDLVALYGGKANLNKNVVCDGRIPVDALLTYNNVHMVIKDGQYWTFTRRGLSAGPFSLNQLLDPLGGRVPKRVDAAFSFEDRIYLFADRVCYKFALRSFLKKKTVAAAFENLPSDINAAFYDPHERVVHFFKSSKCYAFDVKKPVRERLMVVEGGDISEYWPGISGGVDAATLIEEDKVLLIRRKKCYTFDSKTRKLLKTEDCESSFFKCRMKSRSISAARMRKTWAV